MDALCTRTDGLILDVGLGLDKFGHGQRAFASVSRGFAGGCPPGALEAAAKGRRRAGLGVAHLKASGPHNLLFEGPMHVARRLGREAPSWPRP